MTWRADLGALVGADFAGAYPFRLALRPADLALVLLDRADGALSVFELPGRSRQEAYDWLALGMATYRGGAPPVIERPEYDMPEHPVGDGAPFSRGHREELAALGSLYASAAAVLDDLFGDAEGASPIRCWPHHFDIAVLLSLDDAPDSTRRTVGIGLAPMGGGYDSWYLYATPWPYPDVAVLPSLDGDGHWHTEGWTGVVLTGTDILTFDEAERDERIRRFLTQAAGAARGALDAEGAA